MSMMFIESGPSDDAARMSDAVPAFLETEPGCFKPLGGCSREEVEAQVLSLMLRADALVAEARALDGYLASGG
jgi:hypothetical protein